MKKKKTLNLLHSKNKKLMNHPYLNYYYIYIKYISIKRIFVQFHIQILQKLKLFYEGNILVLQQIHKDQGKSSHCFVIIGWVRTRFRIT